MMGEGLSISDALAMVKGSEENGGFGGGFMWVFFLFFLLAWGGNGMFGNNGANSAAVQGALTRADLCQEFNGQEILGKLDGVTNGICDASYALNNSIKDLGAQVMQGANQAELVTIQNANAGQMAMMQGFNGISAQLAQNGYNQEQCCCQIKQEIAQNRFQSEQNTCSIINAVNQGVQRVIDNQNQQLIQGLRDDLQAANFTIQNNNQTSALIGALRPFPQPAYITCSPYTAANGGCNCAYAA